MQFYFIKIRSAVCFHHHADSYSGLCL
uniref:Uncharacterized protein n=1 Tax=Anguilla anguilla TaxID=7936 RepID=A0A0E9RPS6_ANGAN